MREAHEARRKPINWNVPKPSVSRLGGLISFLRFGVTTMEIKNNWISFAKYVSPRSPELVIPDAQRHPAVVAFQNSLAPFSKSQLAIEMKPCPHAPIVPSVQGKVFLKSVRVAGELFALVDQISGRVVPIFMKPARSAKLLPTAPNSEVIAHGTNTCPSDRGTYICGDRGYCSQCPDNEFCLLGKPHSTPRPVIPQAEQAPRAVSEYRGKVVGVTDGDTITAVHGKARKRVRLQGIDCPERGQAFGTKAKQATSTLVFGKNVTLQTYGTDKYERTVAEVFLS